MQSRLQLSPATWSIAVSYSTKDELADWLTIIIGMIAIAIATGLVIAILKADASFLFAH